MAGIESVGLSFQEFARWFSRSRGSYGPVLAGLCNGFEGWLKIEFYRWLVTERGLAANVDVLLEPKVKLDQRARPGRDEKSCDMKILTADGRRFHFVELKAPFANFNSGKVLKGAGRDLWYVKHLRAKAERAATGSAVVVGVGFDEEHWNRGRATLRQAAFVPADFEVADTGRLAGGLRWDVWTHAYA